MEDHVYVLDFLPKGRHGDRVFVDEAACYALGETELKLFELRVQPGVTLVPGERTYIGKEQDLRDKILHVKKRVGHEELTTAAQNELPFIVAKLVEDRADHFLKFFNMAGPISTRFHALELLPGLGKKTMQAILDERKQAEFANYLDLAERVPNVHHPEKLLAARILDELQNPNQKYHLFVRR